MGNDHRGRITARTTRRQYAATAVQRFSELAEAVAEEVARE